MQLHLLFCMYKKKNNHRTQDKFILNLGFLNLELLRTSISINLVPTNL